MAARPRLVFLSPSCDHEAAILESIVQIQASCILYDHTVATFIPPLSHSKMLQRWKFFIEETRDSNKSRIIMVLLSPIQSRTPGTTDPRPPFPGKAWPMIRTKDGQQVEVAGIVSLSMPASETGPFRGVVQNLFVSPLHRRQGLATRLLGYLEAEAVKRGRWNLMLDTMAGSPAEAMYVKRGWTRLGVVKDYSYDPRDKRRLVDEVYFVKDLRGLQAEGGRGASAQQRLPVRPSQGGRRFDVEEVTIKQALR